MKQPFFQCIHAVVFFLASSAGYGSGDITILAAAGEASPDGNGIYTAAGFNGNTLVDLNENGQVAFTARLTATSGGTADDSAIIRADKSGQAIILRKGDRIDVLDARIAGLDIAPALNNNGDLAFRVGLVAEDPVSFGNDSAIVRWSSGNFTSIVREGDQLTEEQDFDWQMWFTGTNALSIPVVLSDAGQVTFQNDVELLAPFIGSGNGGAIDTVFFNRFPDGSFPVALSYSRSFLNKTGEVSLLTALETGTSVIKAATTDSGLGSFEVVAQAGDITPDGLGTFSRFGPTAAPDDIPLNGNGEMVFELRADDAVGSYEALYAGSPGSVREIAREDTIPPGSTRELERFLFADIDASGRVAFLADTGFSRRQLWLERPDFSGIDLILENGQDIGVGDWTVFSIGEFVLNNADQLAIIAQLDSASQRTRRAAVLFYDVASGALRPAIIQGDALSGSQISNIRFTHRGFQGRKALNDESQLVFMYTLESGLSGIAMWEPGQPYGYLDLEQVGEGSVTLDPRFELVEGSLYRVPNPSGASFDLSAAPAAGYEFAGWSGDLVSSESSVSISFAAFETLEVTANFDLMAPEITSQPASIQEIVAGDTLLLEVEASGAGLEFEWSIPRTPTRVRGTAVSVDINITDSANGTTLEIESVDSSHAGTYYVRVSNSAGTVESARIEVSVVTPNPAPTTWYSRASDLGGDWRFLPWLRSFNISQAPWIFHPQHGWLYPFGDDPATGMFFWDARQASFLYTTSGFYPTMYRFSDNKWIRYQIGSTQPRWFVDLQTGVWEQVD